VDDGRTMPPPERTAPGIQWEPGEEDYPFASLPGESATAFVRRWIESADYAQVERDGTRYIHEVDVENLINHVTADLDLLRARLEQFGDHLVSASDHATTVDRIEAAIDALRGALDVIQGPPGS
jgi:hypothetical protein